MNDDSELNDSKLNCLDDGKIYVSDRNEFNDPYDDKGNTYQKKLVINFAEKLGMKWILNDIYPDFKAITCFAQSGINNFAMWAHYANNHQGYCVEYDLLKNFKLCSMILPVKYVDTKIDLTEMIKNRLKMAMAKNNVDTNVLEDTLEFCTIFLSCVKHKTWSYEEEIRFVCPKNMPGMPYFEAVPDKIYIGLKCSKEYENRLLQIGQKLNIAVYKMELSHEKLEYQLKHRIEVKDIANQQGGAKFPIQFPFVIPEKKNMKKLADYVMKRKGVLNAFVIVGGIFTVLSKYGCCFYIYHQPQFPDALKDVE